MIPETIVGGIIGGLAVVAGLYGLERMLDWWNSRK